LLDELTSVQLSEWQAYDRLEPIGEERREYSTASLSALIVNISRKIWGEKGAEMVSSDLFMPEWDADWDEMDKVPVKKQTVAQMKEIALGIVGRQNRKVERDEKISKRGPPKKLKGKNKK